MPTGHGRRAPLALAQARFRHPSLPPRRRGAQRALVVEARPHEEGLTVGLPMGGPPAVGSSQDSTRWGPARRCAVRWSSWLRVWWPDGGVDAGAEATQCRW